MMPHPPRAIAQAIFDVVTGVTRRGQATPSDAVQRAAATTIGHRGITCRRALAYDVPSESEPGRVHVVALYLRLKRDRSQPRATDVRSGSDAWRNEITGARCSCPNRAELAPIGGKAGDGRPPCKHIIAALALARLDGYRLEEPKT
jgi:hypothetical protein